MKKILVIFFIAIFSITSLFSQSNKKWTDVELSKYGIGKEKGNDGKDHLVYDKVETLEVGKTYKWLNTSGKSEPSIDKNSGSYGFGLYEVVNGKQNSYPSATLWMPSKDAKNLYGQTKVWNGFEELGLKETWSNKNWGWGTRDENVGEWVYRRLFTYTLAKIYTDAEYAKFGIGKEKGSNGNEYLVYDKVEKLEKGKTYKWLNFSGGTEPETDPNNKNCYRFGLFEVVKGKVNSYPSAALWVTTSNAQKLYGQTKKWNGFEDLGLREEWSYQNWGFGTRDENTGEWVSHRYFSYRLNKVVSDKELAKYGVIKKYYNGTEDYVYDEPIGDLQIGKTYRWLNTSGGTEPETFVDSFPGYLFGLFEITGGKIKSLPTALVVVYTFYPEEDAKLYGMERAWNGLEDLQKIKLKKCSASNDYREKISNSEYNENLGIYVGHAYRRYDVFNNNIKSIKDIIKNYGGYDKIVSKGFDINSLDNVTTAQELHAALRPYLIDHHFFLDGTPGFKCSKEIVFLDEYSKKVNESDIFSHDNYMKNPEKEDWYAWYPLKNSYRKIIFKEQTGNSKITNIKKDYLTEVYKDLVYIYISTMRRPFVYEKLTSMFDACKNKKYIVIDTRNNTGGDPNEARAFFNMLEEAGYKGTIYLIVNRNCFSAGENICVYAKYKKDEKTRRNLDVYVVGENTGGGVNSGDGWFFEYNGITMSMPMNAWNSGYEEGVGIIPDLFSTEDDLLATMKLLTGVTLPFDKL